MYLERFSELFQLEQTDYWTSHLLASKSLQAKHGNYTLVIEARDLGIPTNIVREKLHVCVTDFNDHAPVFRSPPHNTTLRVPEVRIQMAFKLNYIIKGCLCI